MQMHELLTTDEAAEYLRLSERKLYELVANSAVPCSKVTGRWLFPKAALDQWVTAGDGGAPGRPPRRRSSAAAMIRCWNGRCARAAPASPAFPKAAKPACGDWRETKWPPRRSICIASTATTTPPILEAVAHTPGLHDAVVIAFARREQGLLVLPGNPLKLSDIASGRSDQQARGSRMRPQGAGAQLLLLALLAKARIDFADLRTVKPPCPTGPDIAQAIRSQRADCGIATRAVARSAGLDFVPLDLGDVRPGAAAARLFPAGAAGAVRLHARARPSPSAPPNSAATT